MIGAPLTDGPIPLSLKDPGDTGFIVWLDMPVAARRLSSRDLGPCHARSWPCQAEIEKIGVPPCIGSSLLPRTSFVPVGVSSTTPSTIGSQWWTELYQLFPKGPAKLAAKIAGSPKPRGCI